MANRLYVIIHNSELLRSIMWELSKVKTILCYDTHTYMNVYAHTHTRNYLTDTHTSISMNCNCCYSCPKCRADVFDLHRC